MEPSDQARQIGRTVEQLKALATELYDHSAQFPAVNRNAKRILASVKMLEINVEDWATDNE